MARKNSYLEIYDQLKREITEGKISMGSMLPPEKDLSEKLHVSRPTIAKVYNTLQSDGYVQRRAGYGTTVIFSSEKKLYTFGLLLPGSGETEIFRIIIDQFIQLEKEGNFTCFWEGTVANNADVRKEIILKVCKSYIDRKVDGVFFSPLERTNQANDLNLEICQLFVSKKIPVVLIDRDVYLFPDRSPFDLVGIDNFQAGYIMARHLLEAGCEHVYFFCRRNSAYTVDMRIAGCKAAMSDNNQNFPARNILVAEPNDLKLIKSLPVEKGKTGILCANDSTAAVLMSALTQAGIAVGRDVLIAGFDDMKYSKNLQVPLTTYRQPCQDIGRLSIDMMFNRLRNPNQPAVTISLNGKLVARESSVFK
jgi:GntR family transcriptional regulator, arabinose operon transcriptional repressor